MLNVASSILVVVAHPDDETIWAGGALLRLVDLGFKLTFVVCSPESEGEHGGPHRVEELQAAAALYPAEVHIGKGCTLESVFEILNVVGVERFYTVITHSCTGERNNHLDHVFVWKYTFEHLMYKNWFGHVYSFSNAKRGGEVFYIDEDLKRRKREILSKYKSQKAYIQNILGGAIEKEEYLERVWTG
jgi:hypothetical protein